MLLGGCADNDRAVHREWNVDGFRIGRDRNRPVGRLCSSRNSMERRATRHSRRMRSPIHTPPSVVVLVPEWIISVAGSNTTPSDCDSLRLDLAVAVLRHSVDCAPSSLLRLPAISGSQDVVDSLTWFATVAQSAQRTSVLVSERQTVSFKRELRDIQRFCGRSIPH